MSATPCDRVRRELARVGLLLLQDKTLPSVVGVITGEQLSSSWWSHPRSQEIFDCLHGLEESECVTTRLISGKVTYVHKRLWPALVAVARSNDDWQTNGLTAEARTLNQRLQKAAQVMAKGKAAKELQLRLLAAAEDVHTDSGRHESRLETWAAWAARKGVAPLASAALGYEELEKAAELLGARQTLLPWHSR